MCGKTSFVHPWLLGYFFLASIKRWKRRHKTRCCVRTLLSFLFVVFWCQVGVALLMAGVDCGDRPVLYHLDPSGEQRRKVLQGRLACCMLRRQRMSLKGVPRTDGTSGSTRRLEVPGLYSSMASLSFFWGGEGSGGGRSRSLPECLNDKTRFLTPRTWHRLYSPLRDFLSNMSALIPSPCFFAPDLETPLFYSSQTPFSLLYSSFALFVLVR